MAETMDLVVGEYVFVPTSGVDMEEIDRLSARRDR